VNALLNIRGAQSHVLADGTPALLLEDLQNATPGGVGDGVQDAIQVLF
jgi:hypothetical protein